MLTPEQQRANAARLRRANNAAVRARLLAEDLGMLPDAERAELIRLPPPPGYLAPVIPLRRAVDTGGE